MILGMNLLLGPVLPGLSAWGLAIDDRGLVAWVPQPHGQASAPPPADLTSTEPPTAEAVACLVRELGNRDPVIREAAVRRLAAHPNESTVAVVEALTRERLAVRLAVMELLALWKAPVRDMDPWRPETFSDDRLKALHEWAVGPHKQPGSRPAELSDDERASAGRDLADLMRARSPTEVQAIRERLARLGVALLPEVCARLGTVENDQARERLTALRYRLAASGALAVRWPSGFERLASTDAGTRRRAAEELGRFAGPADVSLLIELFSSPDALVREIGLRLLNETGGAQTADALVRLLADPEPNVRAAVLKQLAEEPSPSLASAIAAYVAGEADPDLIVYAIRALRAARSRAAAACLIGLLKNPAWQVRAEAAEALSVMPNGSSGMSGVEAADVYAALIGLLEDEDGFVVSRAVAGLRGTGWVAAVEPLVRAVGAHPELAAEIVAALASDVGLRYEAVVHLRSFCAHAEPAVRAAAIAGLGGAAPDQIEKEMLVTLADPESQVRIAAANTLFQIMDACRVSSDSRFLAVQPPSLSPGSLGGPSRRDRGEGSAVADSGSEPSGSARDIDTQPAPTQPGRTRPDQRRRVSTGPAIEDPLIALWRSGRSRPSWMRAAIPLLEKMLAAPQVDERVAACRPLVGLGREDLALPVLLADVRVTESGYARIVAILPWLPIETRREFLEQLRQMKPDGEALTALVSAIAQVPDDDADDPLWALLASPTADIEVGAQAFTGLVKVYFGDDNFDPPAIPVAKRRYVTIVAQDKVASGPPMQRLIALVLLLGTAPDAAGEVAGGMFEDASLPDNVRADAFQAWLLSRQSTSARELAVANMTHPLVEVRRLALAYLSLGPSALLHLRNRIWLYSAARAGDAESGYDVSGRINLQPPRPLRLGMLRPILTDPDPQAAAYAGYLVSLFSRPEGLAPLVSYWRTHAMGDETWTRLVYRAAAAVNNEQQVPLLEEIYGRYGKDDNALREFYWTIQTMAPGDKIKKLRARIRDEVGIDRLR